MLKSHTIANNLILPAAIDMVNLMIGFEEANELKTIPLSNNTIISRQTDELVTNVYKQIVQNLISSVFFSVHINE